MSLIESFTIEVVYLDACPFVEVLTGNEEYPDRDIEVDAVHAGLEQPWLDVLEHLGAHSDEHSCVSCQGPVGFVLYENDERPAWSGLRWEITVLARQDGGPVLALCETCHPSLSVLVEESLSG
jgi:hypothetical protein